MAFLLESGLKRFVRFPRNTISLAFLPRVTSAVCVTSSNVSAVGGQQSRLFSSKGNKNDNGKGDNEYHSQLAEAFKKDFAELRCRMDKYIHEHLPKGLAEGAEKGLEESSHKLIDIIKRNTTMIGDQVNNELVKHGYKPISHLPFGKELLIATIHGYGKEEAHNKFKVGMDCSGFKPADIQVTQDGNNVVIRSKKLVANAKDGEIGFGQGKEITIPIPAAILNSNVRVLFDKNNSFLIVEADLPDGINADDLKDQMKKLENRFSGAKKTKK